MIFVLLAVLPALVALLACAVCVPALVAWHVARAERPVDGPAEHAPWSEVMADIDAPTAVVVRVKRLSTGACYPVVNKPRRTYRVRGPAPKELPTGASHPWARAPSENRGRGPPPPWGL